MSQFIVLRDNLRADPLSKINNFTYEWIKWCPYVKFAPFNYTFNDDDVIIINFNEIELYRIIDNNLSNAIKYSKDSSNITISLQKEQNSIKLGFKDEGVGIKDSSKIFERYFRGDKITGGFGIGLSIVKNICEKNGIKIEVKSQINKGSSFMYIFQ